jgi:hypothetical protein
LGPILVPHWKVEGGIFLDGGLNLKVSQFCNLFFDLILCRHVGDRRWLTLLGELALSGLKSVGD